MHKNTQKVKDKKYIGVNTGCKCQSNCKKYNSEYKWCFIKNIAIRKKIR
jgi:hypothetical protein